MFDVTLGDRSGEQIVRAGAIVVATGWKPYDASRLAHLGYGLTPDVVTNVELERMAGEGPILRPSDGTAGRRACCSSSAPARATRTTCPTARRPAAWERCSRSAYLREQDPEAQVYVVYKDMRTPGQYERVLPRRCRTIR